LLGVLALFILFFLFPFIFKKNSVFIYILILLITALGSRLGVIAATSVTGFAANFSGYRFPAYSLLSMIVCFSIIFLFQSFIGLKESSLNNDSH